MNTDNLLYRRQFILGDCPIPGLPEWKSIPFGPFHLKVHPDLETTQAKGNKGEFLLLGFVLNHHRPEANNQELMDEMARTCHDVGTMLEYCCDLCGRYIIIFNFLGKTGLVNDLIGSRSVYYCIQQDTVWCASQPSTLARFLGIDEDHSPAVRNYVKREMFASGEGFWIGDGTKYIGVKHLLPNHYLDFEAKEAFRYWPTSPPGTLDIESASQKSAVMLESIMQAASNRFQLSMAVTAGWESRCLLAATRNVRSNIYHYILKFGGMTDSHPDIKVPRKLAQKFGFPFHVIECSDYQDDAFDVALERNVFVLHNPAKKVLYRSFYQDFQGKVNVSGNAGEITRTSYGTYPVQSITDLLALVDLSHSEYTVASLKDWYTEAKPRCEALGYNLLDLFYWEQRMGNWGSMFAAELDIAIDEFYPFGMRRLVETILAVDEKLPPQDNSSVYRRMIELLWPELLTEPINPVGWRVRTVKLLKKAGKHILVRFGLFTLVKTLRAKMYGR
jgi:hypothetical protein